MLLFRAIAVMSLSPDESNLTYLKCEVLKISDHENSYWLLTGPISLTYRIFSSIFSVVAWVIIIDVLQSQKYKSLWVAITKIFTLGWKARDAITVRPGDCHTSQVSWKKEIITTDVFCFPHSPIRTKCLHLLNSKLEPRHLNIQRLRRYCSRGETQPSTEFFYGLRAFSR